MQVLELQNLYIKSSFISFNISFSLLDIFKESSNWFQDLGYLKKSFNSFVLTNGHKKVVTDSQVINEVGSLLHLNSQTNFRQ